MKADLFVLETSQVSRRGSLVTSGVPLPQGQVKEAAELSLSRQNGEQIPCQCTPLNHWPDGSVKWVLLDFRLDLDAGAEACLALSNEKPAAVFPRVTFLRCRSVRDGFAFRTGALRATLPRRAEHWIEDVALGRSGGIGLLTGPVLRLGVTDAGHKPLSAAQIVPSKSVVELEGPERTVIRQRGWIATPEGDCLFRYTHRLHLRADSTQVRVETTLTQLSEWPLLLLREWSLIFPLPACAAGEYRFGGSQTIHHGSFRETQTRHLTPDQAYGWKTAVLVQDSPSSYHVSASHRLDDSGGTRAPGWVDLRGEAFGLTVAVRHFWQQFPVTLIARGDGAIEAGLIPKQTDQPFRMERGAAKTFELMLDFHRGDRPDEVIAAAVADYSDPLFAAATPAWYHQSGAFGPLPPFDPSRFPEYDLAAKLHAAPHHPAPPFGPRHYGDQLFLGTTKGKYAFVNLEYDTPLQDIHRFARTGCRAFLNRALLGASHQADIDTNHATGHQLRHSPLHTTWMPDLGHVTLGGLVFGYLLTGQRRLLNAAKKIGRWLCDSLAAGVSHFGSGRHIGWPLIALQHLYRETGERKYLDAARRFIQELDGVQLPSGEFACTGDGQTDIPFFCGLAAWGVAGFAEISGDKRAAKVALGHVDYLLGLYPEYAMRTLPALVWAHRKTGDRKYLDFAERTYETSLVYNREGVITFAHPYLAWRERNGLVSRCALERPLPPLHRSPECHGETLEPSDRIFFRWTHSESLELLVQRFLPLAEGTVRLATLSGEQVAELSFSSEPRTLTQQQVLRLPSLQPGDYVIETRTSDPSGRAFWQIWCALVLPMVRFSEDRLVLAPVFGLAHDCEWLQIQLSAEGEGYKSATLYDRRGKIVLAVHEYIDLDDTTCHRSQHAVDVADGLNGLWHLDLVGYQAVVPQAEPWFARSTQAFFLPGVQSCARTR